MLTVSTTGDMGCELRDELRSGSAVGIFMLGDTTSRPDVGSGFGYSGGRMPKLPDVVEAKDERSF